MVIFWAIDMLLDVASFGCGENVGKENEIADIDEFSSSYSSSSSSSYFIIIFNGIVHQTEVDEIIWLGAN